MDQDRLIGIQPMESTDKLELNSVIEPYIGENEDPDESIDQSQQRETEQEDDSDDDNFEVCFVVQNVEFFTFK